MAMRLLLPVLACRCVGLASAAVLQHPGGWHSAADIGRVRALLAANREPWKTAAAILMSDTTLTKGYNATPAPIVCRTCCNIPCCDPGAANCTLRAQKSQNCGGMERDTQMAYYMMLRWVVTSDPAWADAAERVIDDWSGALTAFAGSDQMLAAGLYGGHMAQACELLAYAKPSWEKKARAQRVFLEIVHPSCDLFCGRSNTAWPLPKPQTCANAVNPVANGSANGNWDAVCMNGVASWAVFLDNTTMLGTVSKYFNNGAGNGKLTNYIQNAAGQCQESGRDQGHTQLGIFSLLQAALTIFHATNVTTIFTMADRRLQAGIEYSAKYNLGEEVPFVPNCAAPCPAGMKNNTPPWPNGMGGCDKTGLPHPKGQGWCYHSISNASRGQFGPHWEMAGAVYGSAVPYTQQLLHSNNGSWTGDGQQWTFNNTKTGSYRPEGGTVSCLLPLPLASATGAGRECYSCHSNQGGGFQRAQQQGGIIPTNRHIGFGMGRFGTLMYHGMAPIV